MRPLLVESCSYPSSYVGYCNETNGMKVGLKRKQVFEFEGARSMKVRPNNVLKLAFVK